MASSKNIEQSEVPAKVWQIEALAEKTMAHMKYTHTNTTSEKAPRCEG